MEDQPLVIHRRQRNCETQQIAMDRVNAERRQAAEKHRQEREAQRQERQLKKKVTEAAEAIEKSQSDNDMAMAEMIKAFKSVGSTISTAVIGGNFITPTTWVTSGATTTTPLPSLTTGGAISGYYNPDTSATYSVTINGQPISLGTETAGYTTTVTYES